MRPVLARERPPTYLMYSGGVSEAWRTAHGHSPVQHPGCSGLPGANRLPLRILVHGRARRDVVGIAIDLIFNVIINKRGPVINLIPGPESAAGNDPRLDKREAGD